MHYFAKIGIITVIEDEDATVHSNPSTVSTALAVEEQIVLDDVGDLPTAFALLFGLIYALNLDYPKKLKYMFEVIQKVFMHIGTECSARVQSLKNKELYIRGHI